MTLVSCDDSKCHVTLVSCDDSKCLVTIVSHDDYRWSDSKVRYITSREDMKRGIAREGGRPGLVATTKSHAFFRVFRGAPPPLQ